MKIQFVKSAKSTDVAIVVGLFEGNKMSSAAKFLDETTHNLVKNTLKNNRFTGKVGQTLSLIAPNDLKVRRILLLGMGKQKELTPKVLQDLGGHLYAALAATPDAEAVAHLADLCNAPKVSVADTGAHLATGFLLRSWRFDKYRTKQKAEDLPKLAKLTVISEDAKGAEKAFAPLKAMAEGVFLCRDVTTEPANTLYPEVYANRIKTELEPLGVKVEILGEKEMTKLGMGCLLGVGQGSDKESKMVVMQWNGGDKKQKPVAFIGKGVTFDTGGISLKPGLNMHEMKHDMAGSAAVVGLMKSLAGRKAKANVVGCVGLVENMPGGNAIRPGDILTSMSGQTVEVLNTDAEGRLVLADALWYVQDRFKPQFMINLATLTGAIVVTFADLYAGLFSNNDALCKKLMDASDKTGEHIWRLPMCAEYNSMLKSVIADMQNITNGRGAGSITAAQFLERFVNDIPWAHLDIAGTAWVERRQLATAPKGATGIGVRLLDQLVKDHYES